MRIGNNSQGIWQFFSKMNNGKANMNMPFSNAVPIGRAGRGYCGNTIDSLRSGRFKNSYGVEGMEITARVEAELSVKDTAEYKKQHAEYTTEE